MDPEKSTMTLGGAPPIPATAISPDYVSFLIVCGVFTTITTGAVVLRFLSRRLTKSTGADDWMSLGALFFIYIYVIATALAATIGRGGYHLVGYTPLQFETYLKLALASSTIYNCSISMSKLAVLLFYRRVFDVKSFRIWIWVGCAVVTAYWIAAVFGLIFAYTPVQAQWKFWLPSKSIKNKDFWLAAGIINIIIDFCILTLPQFRVWKLQMSRKRRALLSLLFMLGFFTCITSIVRIAYLQRIDLTDLTYTLGPAGIWTYMEAVMSCICSCAPLFPALFRHWHDGRQSSMFKFSSLSSGWSRFVRRKGSQIDDLEGGDRSNLSSSTQSMHKEPKNSVYIRQDVEVSQVEKRASEDAGSRPRW